MRKGLRLAQALDSDGATRDSFLSAILAPGYRLEMYVCAAVSYMSMKGIG